MRSKTVLSLVFLCVSCSVHAKDKAPKATNDAILDAETTTYCDLQNDPEKFKNKMIRVRALYQTDFEKSSITSPSCDLGFPWTWVDFNASWESHSGQRIRHALSKLKWGQADVIFVGRFSSGGSYGHTDMYHARLEVYRVEDVRPSGSFQLMPTNVMTRR